MYTILIKKMLYYLKKDHVLFENLIIPHRRFRLCGNEFSDDSFFIQSAENEVEKLIKNCKLTNDSMLLDIGCGTGKLPIGLLRKMDNIKNYCGIDVDRISINWCEKHIEEYHKNFRFNFLNIQNDRYNKSGIRLDDNFSFQFDNDSFDVIYLYSVFSHMVENDIKIYTKEFHRILKSNGKIFITAFVEEDVPNITINPENYALSCSGPLHVVRFNKTFLFSIFKDFGFKVDKFDHRVETNYQSGLYLSKI